MSSKYKKVLVHIDPLVHVQLVSFLTLNHISFSEWLRNVMLVQLREMAQGHPFVLERRKRYLPLGNKLPKREQEDTAPLVKEEDAIRAFLGED